MNASIFQITSEKNVVTVLHPGKVTNVSGNVYLLGAHGEKIPLLAGQALPEGARLVIEAGSLAFATENGERLLLGSSPSPATEETTPPGQGEVPATVQPAAENVAAKAPDSPEERDQNEKNDDQLLHARTGGMTKPFSFALDGQEVIPESGVDDPFRQQQGQFGLLTESGNGLWAYQLSSDTSQSDSDPAWAGVQTEHFTLSSHGAKPGAPPPENTATPSPIGLTISVGPGTAGQLVATATAQLAAVHPGGGDSHAIPGQPATAPNHAPDIQGQHVAAKEAGQMVTGHMQARDVDPGDTLTFATSAKVAGFTFHPDGSYTFDPTHSAYNQLAAGQSQVIAIPVTVTDNHGASGKETLQITITGTNDGPALQTPPALVAQEGGAVVHGQLTATDPDTGDKLTYGSSAPVIGFAINPDGSYTLDPTHPAYNQLAAGQQQVLSVPVTVTDSQGATTSQNLQITITGTNDGPMMQLVPPQTAHEGDPPVHGQLTATDPDTGDTLTFASTAPVHGFAINADGSYTFDPSHPAYNQLAVGQSQVLSIPVTVTDSQGATSSQNLQITLTGTNDGPMMQLVPPQTTHEGDPTVHGQLTATDPDTGDTLTYGSPAPVNGFAINPDGSYTFDPAHPAYNQLAVGQSQVLSIPVTVTDSQGATGTQTLQITITGTNDGPLLQAVPPRAVHEDDTAIHGQLTATDPDTGDTQTFSSSAQVAGFSLNTDGSYTFDPKDAAYQHLAAGQTEKVTIPVTVTDSAGATSSQNLEITVTGTNDGAIITGQDTGSVKEDVGAGGFTSRIIVYGKLDITDVDTGESQFTFHGPFRGAMHGTYGDFGIKNDGSWQYSAKNDELQKLGEGQQVTDKITITSKDGTSHDIVITITGTNDAPKMGATTASATEDGVTVTGTLHGTDVDTGDKLTYAATGTTPAGFTLNTDGSWSFDPKDAAYQHLAAGQSQPVQVAVEVTDSTGATATSTLTITVAGTNDAPVVAGAVTLPGGPEDQTQVFTPAQLLGQTTDVDTGTTLQVSGPPTADHGTFSANSDGTFTFHPEANYNGPVAVSYQVTDGTAPAVAASATMTLAAVGDPALITGVDTGSLTEDTGVTAGQLQTGGTLTITDPDAGEDHFTAQTGAAGSGNYGTFNVDTQGHWTYTADNSQAAIQNLGASSTPLTDSLTVTSADGTQHTITVTINGSNDAPTLQAQSQSTTEDGTLLQGRMTATDADTGDTRTFSTSTQVAGFSINTDGSYTFDPKDAAYQHLAAGQTEKVTIPVTVTDSAGATSSQNLEITVTGTNDGAVITGQDTGSVKEDVGAGGFTSRIIVYGKLDITDVDTGESQFTYHGPFRGAMHGTYGDFGIKTDGSWQYSAKNDELQKLGEGQQVTDKITITSKDGTTHDIVITITGTNDAPQMSATTASATEDGATVTGTLHGTDVDTGDKLTYAATGTAPAGFTLNTDGSWSFDPKDAAYQHLAAGQSQPVQIPVEVTDSSGATATSTLTITVTGTDDAPVVSSLAHLTTPEDTALHFTAAELIAGMSDADGPLSVVDGTVTSPHGTISGDVQHGFTFTPAANFHGDSLDLQFKVTDGTTQADGDARLDVKPVTDAATPTMQVMAEQQVLTFDQTGTGAALNAGNLQTGGPITQLGVEFTVIGGPQVANQGIHGATFISYATQHSNDEFYVWNPSDLTVRVNGHEYATGINTQQDTDSHRYTVLWDSHTGSLDVMVDGQVAKHVDGVAQGFQMPGDGKLVLAQDQDAFGGGFAPQDAYHGQIFDAAFSSGPVDKTQLAKAPLRDVLHGSPSLIADIQMQGGQAVDLTGKHQIQTQGGVTSQTVMVDTSLASPNPGATLHLHLSPGAPADSDDRVTANHLLGFAAGTVVSDGAGHTITVTGPTHAVDVTGWNLADISARLPSTSHENMNLQFEVTTTGPDGAAAIASTSSQVIVDPTQPIPDAVIGGADQMTTDEDTAISGVLTIQDGQAGQDHFTAHTDSDGQYGKFSITSDGHWTYTPDDRADALNEGITAHEQFTVSSTDGSTHQVLINLQGTDDSLAAAAPDEPDMSITSDINLMVDSAALGLAGLLSQEPSLDFDSLKEKGKGTDSVVSPVEDHHAETTKMADPVIEKGGGGEHTADADQSASVEKDHSSPKETGKTPLTVESSGETTTGAQEDGEKTGSKDKLGKGDILHDDSEDSVDKLLANQPEKAPVPVEPASPAEDSHTKEEPTATKTEIEAPDSTTLSSNLVESHNDPVI